MKPIEALPAFPEFANINPGVAPGEPKYSQGFVPADTFPAEWANYLFNKSSKCATSLNGAVSSIWAEMGNVLSNFNITPDESASNQLMQALNALKSQAALAAPPVGSLYWTSSTENPATTFGGGTWVQIKDKFVLAAGDTYTNGGTGGAATVAITMAQMPRHTHNGTATTITTGDNSANPTFSWTGSHAHDANGSVITNAGGPDGGGDYYNALNDHKDMRYVTNASSKVPTYKWTTNNSAGKEIAKSKSITVSGTTSGTHTHSFNYTPSVGFTGGGTGAAAGGADAHENMPPYIVKYCWERTA